jgi:hypothetical protein
MSRTKALAGVNETQDIAAIVTALKSSMAAGIRLRESFLRKFRLNLYDARLRAGGNRSTHYDFQVLVGTTSKEATWKNVEHKGSRECRPVGTDETPWAAGVQFHNGGCDKYSIGPLYARAWYNVHVGSGTLKTEWSLDAAIPSFEEWYDGDAKRQGDPSTAFGIELKTKVRAALGDKKSLTSSEYRAAAHAAFNPTAADLDQFKGEALTVLNEALEQKDYWLTIHGDILGDFHCAWFPKFVLASIDEVTVRKDELDIWFDLRSGPLRFSCILRWGKGVGFSNLRIDAR